MNHITLDRAGADDRNLNHEVVESRRRHERDRRHLRSALDLEYAERVGLADHRVGGRVLGRDCRQVERHALVVLKELERAPHAAEHSESEHIDLHEAERVDVVLVPFDHLPVVHRGRLNRHQFVEPVAG